MTEATGIDAARAFAAGRPAGPTELLHAILVVQLAIHDRIQAPAPTVVEAPAPIVRPSRTPKKRITRRGA